MEKNTDLLFEKKVGVLIWAGGFAGIIGIRIAIERLFVPVKNPPTEVLIDYLHNFLFFLIAFVGIWLVLAKILHCNPTKLAFVMLAGSWLIVFPPLLDMLKTGGSVYWSFYALDSLAGLWGEFITIFGNLPSGIMYFGTKIVFIIALIIIFGLIYLRTKKIFKALSGGLMAYIILFFMSSFPSWFAYAYYFLAQSRKITDISGVQVAQVFGVPAKIFGITPGSLEYSFAYNLNLLYFPILCLVLAALFWLYDKHKFTALIKNARLPQTIGHLGFFAVGICLGFFAYPERLEFGLFSTVALVNLVLAVWLAWIASVVINDIYDFEIDTLSNFDRPLPKGIFEAREYFQIGIIFFSLSVLGGLVVSPKFAVLLFVYQFIAWAYSAEPFHLKKIPVVGTLLAAADLTIVLFIGFTLISGDNNIQGLSWRIILLLLLTLTLALPLKDFKDIEADKKHGIRTLPVLLGEEKGRLFMAAWAFVSFVLTVFFLNEFRLFWWAVLCGAGAFLVIVNKKTNPRHFFWWVLGIAAVYGVILVKIIFL